MDNNESIDNVLIRPDVLITDLVEAIACDIASKYDNICSCGIRHIFDPKDRTHSWRMANITCNDNTSFDFSYKFGDGAFAMGISFENDVVATCYYMFKNDIKKPIELQYNKSDYETEGRWPHEVYTIVLSLLAWHKQGKISELVDEMNAEPDLYKRSKLIFKLCEVVGMCDFKEELAKSK
jgi:hypothetical protein